MKPLNLLSFPLNALSLIEASAGTGKTYALANLYVRYLLELGLTVEQILVVTFTEAATQELKDRIRLRIQALKKVFSGAPTEDDVLAALYAQSDSVERDLLRLRMAERQIDQAQIYTIHGFCQQVLRQHALHLNVPLQQSLLEDETTLRKTVIEDLWRNQILRFSEAELDYVISQWADPWALQQALTPLLSRAPDKVLPATLANGFSDWHQTFCASQTWFETLRDQSRAHLSEVIALLEKQPLKNMKTKQSWLQAMQAWVNEPRLNFSLPKTGNDPLFMRFGRSWIEKETPKGKPRPEHVYFDFLEQHFELSQPDLSALFLSQSYAELRTLLNEAKRQQQVLSFDDLIAKLAAGLDTQLHGEDRVQRLARQIGAPFEVALIDEFQDTDPKQYAIFKQLFGTLSPKKQPRLVLIGDPKQAIYGFRGGDIATYLRAKRDISAHPQGQVFTMDTNWRSSVSMVNAVNALFAGTPNAFREQDIPFAAVAANKSDIPTLLPPLQITQYLVEGQKKADIEDQLALNCVLQIKALLAKADSLYLDEDKPLAHADIAILVRTGREGEMLKTRLAEHGLQATLDSQESIYLSEEALALYYLLSAVADPKDETALRRCLAEPLFGVGDERILAFNEQSSVYSHYVSLFEDLHYCWLKYGVLAMIRQALSKLGVFAFWQSQSDGGQAGGRAWERQLTNWNQLAEILQQESRLQTGYLGLLRWYHTTLDSALSGQESSKGNEQTKLRLESDAALIRIVTLHKSKGLEYPVVFMPLMLSARGASEAWFYDSDGLRCRDLLQAEANLIAAEQERLAEDIRLLYVGLTRAKYRCYVGTAAYSGHGQASLGMQKTALGLMLFQGEPPEKVDDASLQACLAKWQCEHSELIQVETLTSAHLEQLHRERLDFSSELESQHEGSIASTLVAQTLNQRLYDAWRVQSFTGIMHESHALEHAKQEESFIVPSLVQEIMKQEPSERQALSIMQFPKGSQAGTFLHTLFEHLEFSSGHLLPEHRLSYNDFEGFVETKLKATHLVTDKSLPEWSAYLVNWCRALLHVPLLDNFCLATLERAHYVSEMQFYFSVKQFNATRFNQLMQQYLGVTQSIDFVSFEGHLKGAIDLVFEHEQRFYILDYKSNYLGPELTDYAEENLALAIEDHRYDVQYVLYTLALHRFLKQRLGDSYDYAQHMGGVLYLFLRGIDLYRIESSSKGIYFKRLPEAFILALDAEISQ